MASGSAAQGELAFAKSLASTLAALPVALPDDYQQPPANALKRIPLIPIDLPPPPKREIKAASPSADTITLTFKSLKPAFSLSLAVSPLDPVSVIKAQLAAQPHAPPAAAQRLLLKGKALADAKLLREYNVAEGDTLNLVVKNAPGTVWDPSAPAPSPMPIAAPTPSLPPGPPPIITMTTPAAGTDANAAGGGRGKHTRLPSVVLSPSPSRPGSSSSHSPREERPADIPLTFDTSDIPTASVAAGPPHAAYHGTIAKPEFWARLYAFLRHEFAKEGDAAAAFEDFLASSKGVLSPHEIARIRDHVGVVGMAGT